MAANLSIEGIIPQLALKSVLHLVIPLAIPPSSLPPATSFLCNINLDYVGKKIYESAVETDKRLC